MADKDTWVAYAERLIGIGYSILETANIPVTEKGATEVRVIAYALLARTLSNMRGVLVLIRENRIVEARVLVRCCLENQFWVAGLTIEGDKFVRMMLNDTMKHRQLRGEFLISNRSDMDDETSGKLRAYLKQVGQKWSRAKMLNPKEVASIEPTSTIYMLYSQLSSDAAHPSVDALARYVTSFDEDGERIRGLDRDPPLKGKEVEATLDWACVATMGVCVGVNQLLQGAEFEDRLNALMEEYSALVNR